MRTDNDQETVRNDDDTSGPEGSGQGRISTGESAGVDQPAPSGGYGPGGDTPMGGSTADDYAQTPNPGENRSDS